MLESVKYKEKYTVKLITLSSQAIHANCMLYYYFNEWCPSRKKEIDKKAYFLMVFILIHWRSHGEVWCLLSWSAKFLTAFNLVLGS